MSGIIDTCVTSLNSVGRGFCSHAVSTFLQMGILVAVLFVLDIVLRRHVRAALRYWIWMLVFVKLLLPPSLSVPTGIGYWCGRYAPPTPATLPQAAESVPLSMPADAEAPTEMPAPSSPPVLATAEPAEFVPVRSQALAWQAIAFLIWGAGVLVFVGLVLQRACLVKRLVAQANRATEPLLDTLDQCRRRMGIRRPVDVRLSRGSFSPAVCGLLRPTILIPEALLDRLSAESLRAVLIHELAHIRRGDLWINSLQTVLQIVYFYNPLVWFANALVRRLREQAVDEMVLVALGAEARSYSTTLIDIAEMAFLRVSPALRLVGVAESRKSLEGRIKHMMTRPIPKSARVGVIGAFVVVALGAILLPMARADPETADPQFMATLSDDVTVELVGVCHWATGKPVCWKPDGSPFDMPMRARDWNRSRAADDYGFMLRVAGTSDFALTWAIDEAHTSSGSADIVDAQGNRLGGYKAITASITEAPKQITVRVGLATSPWRTVWTHDGKAGGADGGDAGGMLWSPTFEDADGIHVVASTGGGNDADQRIVAVDANGKVRAASSTAARSVANIWQLTATFPGLKRDDIKEFQFQVRPYQWVAFEDVSLRSGLSTAPQVRAPSVGRLHRTESLPPAKPADTLPNLFVMGPADPGFDVFGAVLARAADWTWNKTGRNHAKKSYDEIFDGTHNRTDHDVLVLLFALDREDRLPSGYEDLLTGPWSEIEEQVRQGRTVERSSSSRGMNVVLLAAPTTEGLQRVIGDSRLLREPKALVGSSGKGCDVAVESFKLVPGRTPGVYRAVASIRNDSDVASPQAIVHFMGVPAISQSIHGAGPLKPNETWHETTDEFSLQDGAHTVLVVLDPANLIDERDETNNRASLTIEVRDGQIARQAMMLVAAQGSGPRAESDETDSKALRTLPPTTEARPAEKAESAKVDLAIGNKDLAVTKLSDRLFEAVIRIRNDSPVPFPRFRVNFYAGDPEKGGRLLSPQQAGPILPGDSWAEYNPALELRSGERVISVVVDPDNRVEESDETNNKASLDLSKMVSASEQVARVDAIRKLDLSVDDIFQVEAQASKGFHFPYYLFIPAGINRDSPVYMLVETNNSGMVSDDWGVHQAKALTLVKTSHANRIARRLGVPLLVPTFPRPRPETHAWAYTHALDIDTLEMEEGELHRIDKQLTAMIRHAQELLRTNGFKIHEKVLMHGFSASAKFCNRYCYLHPEMVKAAAAGGVNGLPTLPVREWNGYTLPFPIGLAGIERFTGRPFDEKAFRQVAQYIYMGSSDRNDTLLSREAWREEEAAIIRKALSAEKMMPDRWEVSRSIYRQQQLPAQLVTYDGVGHSIRSEMLDDVIEFFKANAGENYVPIEPSAVRP